MMKEILKAIYRGWMKFAHFIGRINTAIILTLFYAVFIGVGRIALFILRKDILDLRFKDRPSYWKKRQDFKADIPSFLKPY